MAKHPIRLGVVCHAAALYGEHMHTFELLAKIQGWELIR